MAKLGIPAAVVVLALLCVGIASPGRAQTPAIPTASTPAPGTERDAERRETIARVITGIIRFTHWPVSSDKLRVCLMGEEADMARLAPSIRDQGAGLAPPLSVTTQANLSGSAQPQADCNFIYFASRSVLDDADRHAFFRRVADRPILTVGALPVACDMGAMFCLKAEQDPALFGANLDAISRSGLHVDPKVLLLARRPGSAK
ncbi:YfiR family protein [Paraburkholderia bannensis]|nr:YfiR family protein [Paraburkholderia bannensis]RQM47352.1 YfiR family protein [Paraburkholderia bannensis]